MNICLACGASLVLVTMVMGSVCAAQETCADLELKGFRQGDIVRVENNSYVSVTFNLKTSNCSYMPEWFRVKLTCNHSGFNLDVCTVIYQPHTRNSTDQQSKYCRCIPGAEASFQLYKKINQTGRIVYTWTWSDSDRRQAVKKVFITFDVFDSGGSVADSTSTSPVMTNTTDDTESNKHDVKESANVTTVIVIACVVTASVLSIPIATVIAVYVYKRRKSAGVQRADTAGGRRPALETTSDPRPHAQENMPSGTVEGEYSEIAYEFLLQDLSPAKVDEKYEPLLEDKVEAPSEYSQLHYDSSCGRGRGRGRNSRKRQGTHSLNRQGMHCRNTEIREILQPSATVSGGGKVNKIKVIR